MSDTKGDIDMMRIMAEYKKLEGKYEMLKERCAELEQESITLCRIMARVVGGGGEQFSIKGDVE